MSCGTAGSILCSATHSTGSISIGSPSFNFSSTPCACLTSGISWTAASRTGVVEVLSALTDLVRAGVEMSEPEVQMSGAGRFLCTSQRTMASGAADPDERCRAATRAENSAGPGLFVLTGASIGDVGGTGGGGSTLL